MKVCHVITTIESGGAEKQLLLLAKQQVDYGLDVSVIYLKGKLDLQKQMVLAGINVLSQFAGKSFFSQVRLMRNYQKLNPGTIVHAHLPRSEILCALSLRSKSFVTTRHNAERFFPKAPKLLSILLSNFVAYRAFVIISISQSVSAFLHKHYEVPIKYRDQIIYYGFNTSRSRKVQDYKTLGKVRLGTISRLVPQKNLPLMLEALLSFRDSYRIPCVLEIVGEGFQESYLRNLSEELGIAQNVEWRGKISDVDQFYRDIDLFLLTSRYEGFGLVLLEAMSHTLPIVAAANPAILEVLSEEHPGIVFSNSPTEFAKRINLLLANKVIWERAIELQEKQLNSFSIEETTRAYMGVYSNLARLNEAH